MKIVNSQVKKGNSQEGHQKTLPHTNKTNEYLLGSVTCKAALYMRRKLLICITLVPNVSANSFHYA